MPEANIPITLPDGTRIEGTTPVVFIGPNGAGKTRFGVAVANSSAGTRIPALRSIAFQATIQPRVTQQATADAQSKINQNQSEYYRQADELNELLSALKAEHADEASRFREAWVKDSSSVKLVSTKLDDLLRIWHQTFPGRTLDFSTYDPRTTSTLPGAETEPYNSHTMSDGERGAIYLIARVLRAPAGVVVVDEPEVHFHALLARSFWDTLQAERNDCRFVYVTHDLPFALSRRGAEIGIVKSRVQAEMVDRNAGIPPQIIEEILGAASLSLVAKRIIFTEGVPGASIDAEVYGSWFRSPDTAVVPVGGCRAVQDAVHVFQQKKVVSNAEPLGIVERDYFPERYLNSLASSPGIFVLEVHEIEGLLCIPDVGAAVARHQGITPEDFSARYDAFVAEIRRAFVGGRMHKHLVERIKEDIDGRLDGLVHGLSIADDAHVLRASLVSDITGRFGRIEPAAVFDEQKAYLDSMIGGSALDFLRVLPGKDCFRILLKHLGISEELYLSLISVGLRQPDGSEDPTFKRLKDDLVAAFSPHLPPR